MRGIENQSIRLFNPLTLTLSLRERGRSWIAMVIKKKSGNSLLCGGALF
jgi:hypothetical protein